MIEKFYRTLCDESGVDFGHLTVNGVYAPLWVVTDNNEKVGIIQAKDGNGIALLVRDPDMSTQGPGSQNGDGVYFAISTTHIEELRRARSMLYEMAPEAFDDGTSSIHTLLIAVMYLWVERNLEKFGHIEGLVLGATTATASGSGIRSEILRLTAAISDPFDRNRVANLDKSIATYKYKIEELSASLGRIQRELSEWASPLIPDAKTPRGE